MPEPLPPRDASVARPPARYLCLALLCGCAWAFTAGAPAVVRERLTRAPLNEGPGAAVELAVPAPPRGVSFWPAVVLRASGHEDGTTLRISTGGRPVASLTLERAARRYPVALPNDAEGQALHLQGDGPWTLEWLEVATVVGHSRGGLNFAVVPVTAAPGGRWYVGLLVFMALAWLAATPVRTLASRATRWLHAAASLAAVLLLSTAILSPLLSRYLLPGTAGTAFHVLLAPRTLFLLYLVLFALPLGARLHAVRATIGARGAKVQRLVGVAIGAAAVTLFVALAAAHAVAAAGDVTALVGFSRRYVDLAPMLAERPDLRATLSTREAGYDGQFYYFMAFDPFMLRFRARPAAYRAFIDDPPYRYGRAAFSLVIRAVTLGRAQWFPPAMLAIVVAAHAAAAVFFGLWIIRYRRSAWWLAAYAANAGLLASLLFVLPEALAAALLVAGVYFWDGRRACAAAAMFAAAMLVRETSAVVVVALLAWELLFHGRDAGAAAGWRRAAALAASAIPMVAWRAYMCWRFFPVERLHGFWANPSDLTMPFAGIVTLWAHLPAAPLDRAGLVLPALLIAAVGLALVTLGRGEPLALAAAVYGVLALSLNYDKIWTHLPSGERATCEFWLMLALIAVRVPDDAPRLRRAYKALFAALALYVLWFAPEAASVRAGLLL